MRGELAETPFFVVGAGRSGTTLLRSLLSAHPRLAVTPETHFLKRCQVWGDLPNDSPGDFGAFWDKYVASTRFADLGVDAADVRRRLNDPPTLSGIFAASLAAYLDRCGKQRVGEKTPGHVRFLPTIWGWWPDARVVLIRRDPRAVVASQLRSPWVAQRLGGGAALGRRAHEAARYAGDWAQIHQEIEPRHAGDDRLLTVSYEALVTDAEASLREICGHVGEDFDPAMLTGRDKEAVPEAGGDGPADENWQAWRKDHHARTLRPVTPASLEKWRAELSDLEVGIVESRCLPGMRAAGYEPAQSAARRVLGGLARRGVLGAGKVERRLRAMTGRPAEGE